MMDGGRPSDALTSVLLVDFASPDVPAALARRGLCVFVKDGPGPDVYTAWTRAGDEVDRKRCERPERIDVVRSYRPVDDLPGVVELAKSLGATVIWLATSVDDADRDRAQHLVEGQGLRFTTTDPFG